MEKFDISIKQLIDCVKKQNQVLAQHAHAINALVLRADLISGITNSKSQYYQDLFVLKETKNSRTP
jgi:hypothetical protein